MKVTEAGLREEYQRASRRARPEGCPPAQALAAAAGEEATRAEREGVLAHVAGCSDCAEELRLAADLAPWSVRMAEALYPREPLGAAPALVALPTRPRPPRALRLPHALAAGLAVACVGLGAWALALREHNLRLSGELARAGGGQAAWQAERQRLEADVRRLQRSVAEAGAPRVNVAVVDLFPPGGVRGSDEGEVPAIEGRAPAALILHPARHAPAAGYAARIVSASGEAVWEGAGLRPGAEGTFTLSLPPLLLPAGEYRVVLLAQRPSREPEPLQSFPLRVL